MKYSFRPEAGLRVLVATTGWSFSNWPWKSTFPVWACRSTAGCVRLGLALATANAGRPLTQVGELSVHCNPKATVGTVGPLAAVRGPAGVGVDAEAVLDAQDPLAAVAVPILRHIGANATAMSVNCSVTAASRSATRPCSSPRPPGSSGPSVLSLCRGAEVSLSKAPCFPATGRRTNLHSID